LSVRGPRLWQGEQQANERLWRGRGAWVKKKRAGDGSEGEE
jgi:hypothetical protein